MRSLAAKAITAFVMVVAVFGMISPAASAQNYPPEIPFAPGIPNPSGDEILILINGNAAANEAANAATEAAAAAANGDPAGAAAAAAKAQAAADKAAKILADAKKTPGVQQSTIDRLEVFANAAAASARAAAASAAGAVASVPAAPPLTANLAFTGSTANLTAALGAGLIGTGGLTLLFARKRSLRR